MSVKTMPTGVKAAIVVVTVLAVGAAVGLIAIAGGIHPPWLLEAAIVYAILGGIGALGSSVLAIHRRGLRPSFG